MCCETTGSSLDEAQLISERISGTGFGFKGLESPFYDLLV